MGIKSGVVPSCSSWDKWLICKEWTFKLCRPLILPQFLVASKDGKKRHFDVLKYA